MPFISLWPKMIFFPRITFFFGGGNREREKKSKGEEKRRKEQNTHSFSGYHLQFKANLGSKGTMVLTIKMVWLGCRPNEGDGALFSFLPPQYLLNAVQWQRIVSSLRDSIKFRSTPLLSSGWKRPCSFKQSQGQNLLENGLFSVCARWQPPYTLVRL